MLNNNEFLEDLDTALSKDNNIGSVFAKYKSEMNHESVKALFYQYGHTIMIFDFKLSSEEDIESYKEYLIAALTPCKVEDGDTRIQRYFKREHLTRLYCEKNRTHFTRDVWLEVAGKLTDEQLSVYLRYFKEKLSEADILSFIERFNALPGWRQQGIARELLAFVNFPEHKVEELLKAASFRHLPASVREKYYLHGMKESQCNIKHLSEETKLKVKHLINLNEMPMLVNYHPDKDKMTLDQWKRLIEIDPRVIRYMPQAMLSDESSISDKDILEWLKANQGSYRAKNRLVSMISRVAPNRISKAIAKKVIELDLYESTHQEIVRAAHS